MANTTFLLDVLRHEYAQRISEVMGESDAFDDQGNLILSPDLKVRHKKSGYEYTIAHVKGDKPGSVQIVLREPEEPRFDAPPEGEEVLGGPDDHGTLNEDDELAVDPRIPDLLDPSPEVDIDNRVQAIATLTDEPPEDEVVFVIDQEEFEKEYEVD
jgi:hypothetical protein